MKKNHHKNHFFRLRLAMHRLCNSLWLLALAVLTLLIALELQGSGSVRAAHTAHREEPAAQLAGDHAIYVRESGTYAADGVVLPVLETLDARYAAAGSEFTVEYWFKLSAGYNSHGKELFDHHVPSNEGFWTAFQNAQLWAGIDAETGNDDAAIHVHTGTGFNDDQWHHYALVRDLEASPDRLCLYLDGVGTCYEDGSQPAWVAVSADIRPALNQDGDDANNAPLYVIGARTSGADAIQAAIDELRISDVARYRSDFTPASSPFIRDAHTVMLFHFDEGSGNRTFGRTSDSTILEGTLVKDLGWYGRDAIPLDPGNPTEATWLDAMWVGGHFGTMPPSLMLLAPNGGESWTGGTQQQIRWAFTGDVGEVDLAYSTDGFTTTHTIVTATANSGVYTWTVPNDPSFNALVLVSHTFSGTISGTISDTSDAAFTIVPHIVPTLTLQMPNGGEVWYTSQTYPIEWTWGSTSTTHVNLSYSSDGFTAISHTIAVSTPNSGVYTWTTPITPSNVLRVRVADATLKSDSTIYDDSDTDFILTETATLSFTLVSPNGGELWHTNRAYPIEWTWGGAPTTHVNLSYSSDGFVSVSHTIEVSAPNNGVYTWTTPVTPFNALRVRVADAGQPTIHDDSDADLALVTTTVPTAGDYAIHVSNGGTYADDAVVLPVFEALESRYAAANREFTVEYWFKFTSSYDPNGEELFDHHIPSYEGFWTAFQNNQLWAGIDTEPLNDDAAIHLHTGSGFNDGQWHHYALVRDLDASPDRLCLYLDGAGTCYEDGSNSQWAAVSADIRSPDNQNGDDGDNYPVYIIGSRISGAGEIEAVIDELRISDVARYRGDFTPPTTPFGLDADTVMLFHFDEGAGNTTGGLSDESGVSLVGTLAKDPGWNSTDPTPLDPGNPTDAAWLEQMWTGGRFGVTPPPPSSTLTLQSPNGGELWQAGSQHPIRWTWSGTSTTHVNLSYSSDGFTVISHIIDTLVPNNGVYTWTTPITPSNTLRVRVADAGNPNIYDDSNASFIITDTIYTIYLPLILKSD